MIPIKLNKKKQEQKNPAEETVAAEEIKETNQTVSEETAAEEAVEVVEDPQNAAEEKSEETAKPSEDYALLNDKYLRLCAEYDNFRKRSLKEKESLYVDIRAAVLTKFLPVYDNLVRALDAPTEDEAYKKGVEMIMNQFNQTLEKLEIKEIPSLGEKFDPNLHNAVMHIDDEEKGENEIVEVFQKGFMTGDKVIRPSMVKVAN